MNDTTSIYSVMTAVLKVRQGDDADEKDWAIFNLYQQHARLRRALERIASLPRTGQPEDIAAETLGWPSRRIYGKFAMPDGKIDAAVNKGLAASLFSGLSSGARVMRKEGVPLNVGLRVLLHPESRRTTDWQQPIEASAAHPATSPDRGDRRSHPAPG